MKLKQNNEMKISEENLVYIKEEAFVKPINHEYKFSIKCKCILQNILHKCKRTYITNI